MITEWITAILEIFKKLVSPFSSWWQRKEDKKKAEERAEWEAEIRSLKLKLLSIKKQLKEVRTSDDRQTLKRTYDNLSDRIMYLSKLLRD